MTATHPAWLWFPSEWISWHAVTLPKTRQWRTALPFLIEEKLASSIDSVKIIPTPVTQDGERYAVAVDGQQWQQWHDQQAALGHSHAAWCPDILALPWSADMGVVVLIEDNRMRVRWGQWQGAAGSIETMMVLLSQLMASSSLPITLYADKLPTQWSDAWQTQHYARASFVPEVPKFDLREGAGHQWWSWSAVNQWRVPLVLFGLLCGVWMLQHTWLAWQANARAQQMQVSTQSLFKQQFPHIKRQVNVLAQARGDLKQRLQAQTVHKTSVQAVIAMVQNQMRGWPNVQQLEWQSGQLTLSWSEDVLAIQREQLHAEAGWSMRWLNDRQVQFSKEVSP
jgi:type II secretion system protein L